MPRRRRFNPTLTLVVSPTGPLLDSDMYPHIFDNIVAHAPPGVLLALRACSHATHKAADNKLFKHVRLVVRNLNLAVSPYG